MVVETNDATRLDALAGYEVLDSEREQPFDELAQLAARICNTPSALVTLVDATRQWFKARVAFPVPETPRSYAFCDHTIRAHDVFVVDDAQLDPRFAGNPLVLGEPRIRFYAGAPLVTPCGHAVGSLAVIDYVPRSLTTDQRGALQMLSRQVIAQLELRKHLAGAFRQRERATQLTAALIDSALDAVVATDREGRLVEFNRAAERVFGCTRDEAIGRDLSTLIVPPESRESHRHGFKRYLETGVPHHLGRRLELEALRADGTRFPVELSVNRVEGEPPIFAGFLRDLSDRNATEQELRRNIERFELVARASNDVMWDRDLASGTIWWSDAFARTYGEPGDTAAWLHRIHPDDRGRVDAGLRAAIEGASAWSEEYRLLRLDQQYASIFDRGYPMCDEAGRPARMVGAMIDLTERRRLEEQVVRSQKLDAIGQLAGGIAHDYNNILTIIECNTFMLSESNLSADHAALVVEVRDATRRASALTRQLLLISRKQPARREVADAGEVVENMSRVLARGIGEHVELAVTIEKDLPAIEADVAMLEQVLLNLAVNARDAMPRGGRLAIAAASRTLRAPTTVQGVTLAAGPYVVLEVADTGVGIAGDVLRQIFEPFFTTKDVGQGAGLGLSTVLAIVREHGGAVDVRTELGRGTMFSVYLPAIASPRERKARPTTERRVEVGTEMLLLVEDEPQLRTRIGAFLRQCGYRTLEASSAVAALEVWATERDAIDLVITDIVMPEGLTGFDLAARLHHERPGLPVIFTSGYSGGDHHETLVEGENFLAKPYAPRALAALIRKRLG